MTPIVFAKQQIFDYLRETRAQVGHVLNEKGLYHSRAIHWNPAQREALKLAVNEMVTEGLLEDDQGAIKLAPGGEELLYPGNAVQGAREKIMQCFADFQAGVGHVINARKLVMDMRTEWTPLEEAAFDAAIAGLQADGLIGLNKSGDPTLTQLGFDRIY